MNCMNSEEKARGSATAMKKEINWEKELLESGRFNHKFSKNLLENGAKSYMQEIYGINGFGYIGRLLSVSV